MPIRLAVGAEIRREKLSYDYDANANRDNFMFLVGNPDFGNDRSVEAAFVELSLPVTEDLNVQVAARSRTMATASTRPTPRSRCSGGRR